MTPISNFEDIWKRCDQLSDLYTFLSEHPDELLRAEWVMRVSALDLYIHELIAQKMLEIFEDSRPSCSRYDRFQISNKTLNQIRAAEAASEASAAFDLEVRERLGIMTFQDPEKIADGIRLCSTIELWNEIALYLGATPEKKDIEAKKIKRDLSLIVQRRNKIAHEGDLQPSQPRTPWPVNQSDLRDVTHLIEKIVGAIDAVI